MARFIAKLLLAGLLLVCGTVLPACVSEAGERIASEGQIVTLDAIPEFSGEPVVELEGNRPSFSAEDLGRESLEEYAALDDLGRCGTAFVLVGPETMPSEKRGSIGSVKPSGWHLVKYDIVDGKYLFNRCHLVAYRLAGENANERNLITGTRYLNVEGMLPLENRIGDYVEATGNHVLLRATPVFEGAELVARGVHLEAQSVEDASAGIGFNVFAYNVQPGITIDYATGESCLDGSIETPDRLDTLQYAYVLNIGTGRFHLPNCPSIEDMKEQNKEGFDGTREEALSRGFQPCGRCNP